MSDKVILLNRLPGAGAAYRGAISTARRKPATTAELPPTVCRVNAVPIDAGKLAAYRKVCGFSGNKLPITYPQVMAAPLHVHLMSRPGFPFPLLGLVHVGNRIEQDAPLDPDQAYDITVRPGSTRIVRAGIEFELLTEFARPGDEPCWRAETRIIHRMPTDVDGDSRPAESSIDASVGRYHEIDAPADIGRRYGRVSGDMNPIHLTAWSAKLLGFKRAIAHGMWSLARCASLLEAGLATPPAVLEVQFRKPLFLPGAAALRYQEDDSGIGFALIGKRRSAVHLSGRLSGSANA